MKRSIQRRERFITKTKFWKEMKRWQVRLDSSCITELALTTLTMYSVNKT